MGEKKTTSAIRLSHIQYARLTQALLSMQGELQAERPP